MYLLAGATLFVEHLRTRLTGPKAETLTLEQDGTLSFDVGGRLRATGVSRWDVPHDHEYFVRVEAQTDSVLPTPVTVEVGPFSTKKESARVEERLKEAVSG